jgi:phosphatidylserine decarboxylase
VATDRAVTGGNGSVVLRVKGGRGPVVVVEVGGAWFGTIMCWTST